MRAISKTATLSRRQFLNRSLAAGLVAPLIVPGRVLGLDGGVAPSNRITLGAIGIGPRGRYVLGCMLDEPDVQFRAICDVQAERRQQVKAMADTKYGNQDCAMYRDMFELLARPDLDTVLVATGDHWHSLASIHAAKAGKDVYSEKPCGLTIGECQDLAGTMQRLSRVFQAGTQRRSIGNFQFAVHLARSGKLGRLHTLHASIYKLRVLHDWLPAEPEPAKDVCDWDRWLGPSPWRPYNKRYVQGGWRGYFDFDSGATLLDWGAHTVDLCQWANGSDGSAPTHYELDPDGNTIRARYANGVRLVMRKDGWLNLGTCPVRFEGDEGWVETGDSGQVEVFPKSLEAERARFVASIRGTDPSGHTRNFFDCFTSRRQPACGPEIMLSSHTACHAAAIAWQLGRNVQFDPATASFVGDEEANRMRSHAKRAPWHV